MRPQPDPDRTLVERIDPWLGLILDQRYRIDLKLAAGGFGAIYRATHLATGRDVAIKVLRPELASDPSIAARFRREAAALARLHDPRTVAAFEAGEGPGGALYIVMELLRGESLYERYHARGPLPWQRMVAIARDVCSSLAEAHALGIVHRDLKPANIHLEPNDSIKVLDFGIAKILDGSELDNTDLTIAGQMIGTFDYMPLEQMLGATCTARSDLYTLGVVMYEMIGGRRPFGEPKGPAAMLAAVIGTTPVPLSSLAEVPAELDDIVMRCIAREPEDRFADAAELATALDRLLAPEPDDEPTTIDPPERIARTTLPGFVAPVMDAKGAWYVPRLAAGTSPIENHPRISSPTFDLSRTSARDRLVGRIVWTLVVLLFAVAIVAIAMAR